MTFCTPARTKSSKKNQNSSHLIYAAFHNLHKPEQLTKTCTLLKDLGGSIRQWLYFRTPTRDHAGIYGLSSPRKHLKIHIVTRNFDQHESHIRIKICGGKRRVVPDIALPELPSRARHKIMYAILGLDPLVKMIVAQAARGCRQQGARTSIRL